MDLIFTEKDVLGEQWPREELGPLGGGKLKRLAKSPQNWWQPRGGDVSTFLHQPWLALFLTVQLSLPPTLYLEGLPRKYVAAQLHLHWGQKGSLKGSEHQINSEATAAEVPRE